MFPGYPKVAAGATTGTVVPSSPSADLAQAMPQGLGLVALLTDYGESDFYVGALKGAILKLCPQARLVDISHDVPPYDVELAAWTLFDSAREYPAGTVVVAIVDPGVGTGRRPILLQTGSGHWFVGPDNGLFTVVERELGSGTYREITNLLWMRRGAISASFHGRDIFGPSAGMLACGQDGQEAGPAIADPVRLNLRFAQVRRVAGRAPLIEGAVLFADHYGNLQTNISAALVDSLGATIGDKLRVEIGGETLRVPFVRTYGDVGEGEALIFTASTGRLELALNQESAAAFFDVQPGDRVRVSRGR